MESPSWLTTAQQLFQEENLEAAPTTLETGLAETPSCADGWELKGRVLQVLQRYGEAVEANQEALKWMQAGTSNSGIASLVTAEDWFNAGNSSFEAGNWEEAIASYDRAVQINPNDYQAWAAIPNSKL